jgi:hypothetical protein
MGDNVFQLGELLNPYRVASSIDLEENSNFCVVKNIFIDVDTEELNVLFRSNGYAQVNEDDDSDEINVEDCDRDDDESIEEEKEKEKEKEKDNSD